MEEKKVVEKKDQKNLQVSLDELRGILKLRVWTMGVSMFVLGLVIGGSVVWGILG